VAPPAFFASIAAGVPVVAAPHRPLQEFVDRYGCGIVMDAWTPEAFRRAAGTALELCRTASYDELVAGCRRACERELNWATQFGKLAGVLPSL
jgi:glycosyltransferase involved in cell wall biosynthesis